MSPVTTFISRRVEVPCGDRDLYAFMTDMNNLHAVLPSGSVTGWEATEERCSFETDRAGRITVTRASAVRLDTGLEMNPLMRMLIGDSAGRYLDMLMDIIESYDGYDMIRGYNQSP